MSRKPVLIVAALVARALSFPGISRLFGPAPQRLKTIAVSLPALLRERNGREARGIVLLSSLDRNVPRSRDYRLAATSNWRMNSPARWRTNMTPAKDSFNLARKAAKVVRRPPGSVS